MSLQYHAHPLLAARAIVQPEPGLSVVLRIRDRDRQGRGQGQGQCAGTAILSEAGVTFQNRES